MIRTADDFGPPIDQPGPAAHPRHVIRRREYDRDVDWAREGDFFWTLKEPTAPKTGASFRTWEEAIQTAAHHDGGAQATTYALMGWRLTASGWVLSWRCWRCWPAGGAPIRGNGLTAYPAQHDNWHYDRDAADDEAARRERFGI